MEVIIKLLPYVLAFVVTLGMIRLLIPVADSTGLVDRPTDRKSHRGLVPLVGGMAMFSGFAFAVLVLGSQPQVHERAMLAGALVLVIAGVLDDYHELPPHTRLLWQILSAALMTLWGGVVIHRLGAILWPHDVLGLSFLAIPVTIFAVVGGINALNLSDGLDGLAGGLALIALVPGGYLALQGGATDLAPFIGVIVCCLVAFWLVNMRFPWQRRARVFMGDSGSMFVGFLIAWILADLSQPPRQVLTPVTALYLFAVPLMDTIFVIARRLRNGLSPMAADRMHLHHMLLDLGLTPVKAVIAILGLAAILAGLGLAGLCTGVPEFVMFYGFLVLFGVFFVTCNRLRRRIDQAAQD